MARLPGREAIYAAANAFRDRCLGRGSSLLWPNKFVWQPENLQALWKAIFENPDEGSRSFIEKLKDQLAQQPPEVHQVAADLCSPRRYCLMESTLLELVGACRVFP